MCEPYNSVNHISAIDVDTRRRAACDLVRALCKSFEAPVIQIFSSYVQHMLLVCFLLVNMVMLDTIISQSKHRFVQHP